MSKNIFILILFFITHILITFSSYAKDVNVNGYYRANGTYVRPHIRSAPDSYKSNNYGPSQTDGELMNPTARDYDKDGTPNYVDNNDDNDNFLDNNDSSQYGSRQ